MIRILVKIDRPLLDFFKATLYTIPSANSYLIVVEGFLCPRDPRFVNTEIVSKVQQNVPLCNQHEFKYSVLLHAASARRWQ